MRLRSYIHSTIGLWMLSMVYWCMCSCSMIWSDEEGDTIKKCEVRQTVTLNLTITHPDASINTRAALGPYELSFTRNEAAVKKMTAFVVDLKADGTEDYEKIEYHSTDIDPIDFYNGIYVFRQTLEVETGAKHIYIGANLRQEHIDAFLANEPITLSGEGPAVNMVMTPDPTHSGQGTDIAMFGQIKMRSGSEDIIISEGTTEYYLSGNLERLTAKVLLTCKEGEPGLVATGGKGWVETDKIRYTLNVTNKKTFINKRVDPQHDINIDPNWELGSWVGPDGTQPEGFGPINDYSSQFESWSPEDLMARLFDERFSATPLRYDESRVGEGNNSENHYVEGLYCLENTSYDNMSLAGSSKDKAARVGTTHLVMAVRFIPKEFVGGWGIVKPASLEYALGTNLVSGEGSGPHSNGTYFTRVVDGKLTYYAYTGMTKTINESNGSLTEADFTCYEGGYSYYTTFIDGNADNLKLTYNGCDSWGVQRDHYYILTVDKITRPGTPIPWDDYIRVNSQTTEWFSRGSQEVVIKPKSM